MKKNKIKNMFSEMISIDSGKTFIDYLAEDGVVPAPSGQTITPISPTGTNGAPPTADAGAPLQTNTQVNLAQSNEAPKAGTVMQSNSSSNQYLVRDDTTGQQRWYNRDEVNPLVANGDQMDNQTSEVSEDLIKAEPDWETRVVKDLVSLRKLAGINPPAQKQTVTKEDASVGASCAGNIATVAAPLGSTIKRQETDEGMEKVEHNRGTEVYKSVVGDTKPNQAIGELSARLVANEKPSAARKNCGKH